MSPIEYASQFNPNATPQSESIPGSTQVPNSADGYAWPVDDWMRMQRFLILGSEGGTYYVKERALTRENAEATLRCITADGPRAVELIASISEAGRAPKNDPAVFALALAAAFGSPATRQAAFAALGRVCRIGTHLFHFMRDYEALRLAGPKDGRNATGRYGRSVRRALAAWYQRDPEQVAFQTVKYGARDGWSHRDVLCLAHPKPPTTAHDHLYKWIMTGASREAVPRIVAGLEAVRDAKNAKDVAGLVTEYRLPREAIERADTKWLSEAAVWEALLPHMPLEAMVRQLGVMTARGLVAPLANATAHVVAELGNAERIKKSRLHPIRVLTALLQYKAGASRGAVKRGETLTWEPVAQVLDALDGAFYAAFGNVVPTGKRLMLALDVSGSMASGVVAGVASLTPRIASAALALVTAAVEPNHLLTAFTAGNSRSMHRGYDTGIALLQISPRQRLDDAIRVVSGIPFGGTDCALPMIYAIEQNLAIDCFVILTDSETWAGNIHPAQALRKYRAQSGIAAKCIIVGMVSDGFTLADPNDAGMLDVVGFDTATPALISDFAAQ